MTAMVRLPSLIRSGSNSSYVPIAASDCVGTRGGFVKGCQMPAHVAMHRQSGTGFRGQASDEPRGMKPRGVGRVKLSGLILPDILEIADVQD